MFKGRCLKEKDVQRYSKCSEEKKKIKRYYRYQLNTCVKLKQIETNNRIRNRKKTMYDKNSFRLYEQRFVNRMLYQHKRKSNTRIYVTRIAHAYIEDRVNVI